MRKMILMGLASCAFWAQSVSAQTTYCVSATGGNVSPYATWANAATNIHDAVALATNGDLVLVTNGLYRLTNQIVVATNFTVRSVNGPDVTTLWRDMNSGSFRLFTVSNAAALVSGFTLTNGNGTSGGAIILAAGTVSNCVITLCNGGGPDYVGRTVYMTGGLFSGCILSNCSSFFSIRVEGGVVENSTICNNVNFYPAMAIVTPGVVRRCRILNNYNNNAYGVAGVSVGGGRLENCLVYSNRAPFYLSGGGVSISGGTMLNCTVAGNSAIKSRGQGVYQTGGTLTNCIIYANGDNLDNYYGDVNAASYSCAPELTNFARGNVSADPGFVDALAGNFHLRAGSPCVDSGTNLVGITNDLEGATRPLVGDSRGVMRHDMGTYEKDGSVGSLEVGFFGTPLSGLNSVTSCFSAAVSGTNTTITWWGWDFDNNGVFDSTGTSLAVVTNTFSPGRYSISVRVTNSAGETATSTNLNYILVSSPNLYVSTNGGNVLPYASWADAATNIHDAVDVALGGCTVWVTNGSYRMMKQIDLGQAIAVRSMNGPQATTLWRDASAGEFRIFNVHNANALVAGFTMTNGYVGNDLLGGGVYLYDGGTVSNCVISKCSAGGGGYVGRAVHMAQGLMTGCIVSNCTAIDAVYVAGGVLEDSTICDCIGCLFDPLAVFGGVVRRCRVLRNYNNTIYGPGGVTLAAGRLENCLIYSNRAPSFTAGGGVNMSGGAMVNCTVVGNSAKLHGDGVNRTGGAITNCIIYGNGANENYYGDAGAVWYSCAPELTNGVQGNVTADAGFVDSATGDFHLRVGSRCVDAGTNLVSITNDLDRTTRPLAGDSRGLVRHDMGAYEKDGSHCPLEVGFFGSPVSGMGSLPCVFNAQVAGTNTTITWWGWDFDNNGVFDNAGTSLAVVTNTFGPGRHSVCVRVTNSAGETASSTNSGYVLVVASNIYVSTIGNSVLPYASWADAATNIHDAMAVALAGCTVWVTNGSYRMTSQIDLAQAIAVRSVNGPQATTVWRDASAGNFRIFNVHNAGALVSGFTMTNGYVDNNLLGGGIYLYDGGTVSDCVVAKCSASGAGYVGRAVHMAQGLMTGCIVSNCSAIDGVYVAGGVLEDTLICDGNNYFYDGLAVAGGVARRCRILRNYSTSGYGPGGVTLTGGRLENCLIYSNRAPNYTAGGGVNMSGGALINCTVVGNRAKTHGDGVNRTGGVITNCIIYANGTNENYYGATSAVWYSCAPELIAGVQGNITADPKFANASGADCHLRGGSPCVNKGVTLSGMATDVDLDKNPRLVGGKVDMGAYEATFQGTVFMIH